MGFFVATFSFGVLASLTSLTWQIFYKIGVFKNFTEFTVIFTGIQTFSQGLKL